MKKFFTGIGKAILYVLGCPFLLVGIALAAVVSLFIFLFQFGKFIYLFFTGRSLFKDFEEDKKAQEILAQNCVDNSIENSALNLYPSDSPVYGSDYSSPVFDDKKEETPSETAEVKEEDHD